MKVKPPLELMVFNNIIKIVHMQRLKTELTHLIWKIEEYTANGIRMVNESTTDATLCGPYNMILEASIAG